MVYRAPVSKLPPVLIVDGDRGARSSVADLLRECGYPVAEACTPIEGLRIARERRPAMIIVDPWPFVSASAAMVRRITQLGGAEEIAVLLVTAARTPTIKTGGRFAEAGGYLEKPSTARLLVAEVKRLLPRSFDNYPDTARPEPADAR